MTKKHTKGLLEHVSGPSLTGTYHVGVTDGRMVFECHDEGDEQNGVDATRIVACVNALAGIADPEAFMRFLRAYADTNFMEQREAALNTLRDLLKGGA